MSREHVSAIEGRERTLWLNPGDNGVGTMKILIVGAFAVGGYFGARVIQAAQDVTFLVRALRRAQLQEHGLVVKSPHGDVVIPAPSTILSQDIRFSYGLI
jgi:2-dehydropantoate 2-reductase